MSDSLYRKYRKYSSKIKRLNIPVPNFKFKDNRHKLFSPTSEFLIGRSRAIEQLETWLMNGNNGGRSSFGKYLVTGYRGMGKTSFVNNVIYELCRESTIFKNLLAGIISFLAALFISISISSYLSLNIPEYLSITSASQETVLDSQEKGPASQVNTSISRENVTVSQDRVSVLNGSNSNTYVNNTKNVNINTVGTKSAKVQEDNSYSKFKIKIRKGIRSFIRDILPGFVKEHLILCSLILYVFLLAFYHWKKIRERLKRGWFDLKILLRYISLRPSLRKVYADADFATLFTSGSKKEWNRINRLVYGEDTSNRSFSNLCVKINLGQEILDERDILCVIASELKTKYGIYIHSPLANFDKWFIRYVLFLTTVMSGTKPLVAYLYALAGAYCNAMSVIDGIVLLLYLLSMYVIWKVCTITVFLRPLRNISRLKILVRRINASLDQVADSGIDIPRFTFSRKRSYSYPIASVREIETHLIHILDGISGSPILSPTIIFVFDELDKIEAGQHGEQGDAQEFNNERYLANSGASRKRMHTVMQLLGNMKYFMSSAKAHFVFIAGREMYDAYLADKTDRESTVSSIFDGVIYINSFCKNEREERDVLYNVETFIALQLLPHDYIKSFVVDRYMTKLRGGEFTQPDINLKVYARYLTEVYADTLSRKGDKEKNKERMKEVKVLVDKAATLLYYFSVYLYHISNGSPKKLKMAFEKRVRPVKNPHDFITTPKSVDDISDMDDLDVRIPKKSDYILSFDEDDQSLINFIYYISYPVNHIITNSEEFSDKLLVSASYLLNHIYKFHTSGFSWRNIEQTPELLEVYRIPGFRGFINSIINYLNQTHITTIPSGIYQYKFRKHIAEELSLASKLYDEVSAIFNFSLDESLSVKEHYRQKIEYYESREQKSGSRDIASYRTLEGLHLILADLYMADEEYNNAVFEYQTAVQLLRETIRQETLRKKEGINQNRDGEGNRGGKAERGNDFNNGSLLAVYIRDMLKLGAAYEKRRTLDSAYNIYNEVVNELMKFREVDESEFDLHYYLYLTDRFSEYEGVLTKTKPNTNSKETVNLSPDTLSDKSHEGTVDLFPDIKDDIFLISDPTKESGGLSKGSKFVHALSQFQTPRTHEVLTRLSMVQDIGIIYQAILSRLFLLEKMEMGGITFVNLETAEGEFRYLHLCTDVTEKFLISTDFYRRMGDIMYYKNGLIGFNFIKNEENVREIEKPFANSAYFFHYNLDLEIRDYCLRSTNMNYEFVKECSKSWKKKFFEYVQSFYEGLKKNQEFIEARRKWVRELQEIRKENKGEHINFSDNDSYNNYKNFLKIFHPESCTNNKCKVFDLCNDKNYCGFFNDEMVQKRISELPIEMIEDCSETRQYAWENGRSLPCYACMYYNRSLYIITRNLFGEEIDKVEKTECMKGNAGKYMYSRSEPKFIVLLRLLVRKGQVKSYKKNYMLQIAEIIDALGNTLLSCAMNEENTGRKRATIRKEFMTWFLKDVNTIYDKETNEINENELELVKYKDGITRIESCMVYYFIASQYFYLADDLRASSNSLKKILRILQNYQRVNKVVPEKSYLPEANKDVSEKPDYYKPNIDQLEEIKETIVYNCLKYQYQSYNHINLTEIQKLKWIFHVDMYEDISLRHVALFPDIEEVMLIYYELVLSVDDKDAGKKNKMLAQIYNSNALGSMSNSGTVYERVLSLKFKTMLNNYIFNQVFGDCDSSNGKRKDNILKHVDRFSDIVKNPQSHKKTEFDLSKFFIGNFKDGPYTSGQMFELMEFIIEDSIYCLTYILDTITPYTSTTLFTNTFIGDVYESLYRWNTWFDALFMFYKAVDTKKGYYKPVMSSEENRREDFFKDCDSKIEHDENTDELSGEKINQEVQERVEKLQKESLKDLYRKSLNSLSDKFFNRVINRIKTTNNYYLLHNYSIENAINFYTKALEIHREGKAYREMIATMHYIDDDLRNDTVQFDLAVERYKINNGYIKEMLGRMKKPQSSIYKVDKVANESLMDLSLKGRFIR